MHQTYELSPTEIFVREINFLRYPYFALSTKNLHKIDRVEFRQVMERENEKIEHVWIVTSHPQFGYPGPTAHKFHNVVDWRLSRMPLPINNPIPVGSWYHVCKRMNIPPDGRSYRRIEHAIRQIMATTIESRFTYWHKGKRRYINEFFHLYEHLIRKGEELDDGTVAEVNYLRLNQWYIDNINERYIKLLDYDYHQFLSTKTLIASRLYEILQIKFYRIANSPETQKIRYLYSTICSLLPITRERYLFHAKKQLLPAHELLVETKFLAKVEWVPVPNRNDDWYIDYYPGERYYDELSRFNRARSNEVQSPASLLFNDDPILLDPDLLGHTNVSPSPKEPITPSPLPSELPETPDQPGLSSDPHTDLPDKSDDDLAGVFLKVVSQFAEFRVNPDKDAEWFRKRIESNPAYQDLDLEEEILNWGDWLESQHRLKEASKSNKFPKSNFRGSFTNWLKKSLGRKGQKPIKPQSDCPQEEIINLYHEICHMCPEVKLWDNRRRDLLTARWNEDPERQNLDWWRDYFAIIADSDFLTGRVKNFVADLEWVLDPNNMAKILNGRYSTREQTTMTAPDAWHMARVIHEWGQKHNA